MAVAHRSELRLHIAGTDALICAPGAALTVVDRMLAHVSRNCVGVGAPIRIDVEFDADLWQVRGSAPSACKTLGRKSKLPEVAGAIVSALLGELAYHHDFSIWRAAVVESDGQALVLIGDDWESCVTLAAHLHTRGWRILGGDYTLVSRGTMVVSAFKKVLHATSSCVASFPKWYRRAIEASPWYSTPGEIAFYAIDPELVDVEGTWGEQAPLRAVLRIDGLVSEHPSLESIEGSVSITGVRREDLRRAGVEIASLALGDFMETCDLVSTWFSRLPAPERASAGVREAS